MDLVLQGEIEGEVFNAFVTVDLHFRGIFICLKMFDDIRKPDRQAIIPAREGNTDIFMLFCLLALIKPDQEYEESKSFRRRPGKNKVKGTSVVSVGF